MFEAWKGALTHTELCRMDLDSRFRYLQCLEEQAKRKAKQIEQMEDESGRGYKHRS